jgi:DNA-directed RNA polymerase specialized sigma24 family protein
MNPLAESIKEDLIQEAVTRMYELSGKVKERANGKYSIGYGFFWVAHNAMLSYLKTWQRQMRWCLDGDVEDEQMARRIYASREEVLWSE